LDNAVRNFFNANYARLHFKASAFLMPVLKLARLTNLNELLLYDTIQLQSTICNAIDIANTLNNLGAQ
jgi:hypothetical protein